jgi:hypothetical protein
MRQRYGLAAFSVAVAFSVASCQRVAQLGDTVRELQEVQKRVSEEAGTHDVGVNLNNGRFLRIGITNSPWENLPDGERRQKALDIAKLAYAVVPARSYVEVVTVTFAARRTFFTINYSKATGVFQFDADDLPLRSANAALSERWVPK